ncbi:hypothetical protein EOL06_24510 [Escherichia coli]|jgi:hypothetical protein|uniref:hypothetical protein n=1 Tax=Escherichia coli TaxID=562 RepID=UPI000FD53E53|nr:hypothetical protein [Escherichia coli]RVS65721.1 hypothetical protein EOL06_24510 [Escherichia coli]
MKIKLFACRLSLLQKNHTFAIPRCSLIRILSIAYKLAQKIEDSIKEIIAKSGKEYSIDMAFYNSQRKSISERCSLYYSMEGQRIDLIENQCEYDGVEQLNNFIKTYMKTVDNY